MLSMAYFASTILESTVFHAYYECQPEAVCTSLGGFVLMWALEFCDPRETCPRNDHYFKQRMNHRVNRRCANYYIQRILWVLRTVVLVSKINQSKHSYSTKSIGTHKKTILYLQVQRSQTLLFRANPIFKTT